jgi:hypothetical protein
MREIEKLCVGEVRASLWKFRYIFGALVRRSFGQMPSLANDKAQREYAAKAIAVCHDTNAFTTRLAQSEKKISDALDREKNSPGFDIRNAQQDRRFVERLLSSA